MITGASREICIYIGLDFQYPNWISTCLQINISSLNHNKYLAVFTFPSILQKCSKYAAAKSNLKISLNCQIMDKSKIGKATTTCEQNTCLFKVPRHVAGYEHLFFARCSQPEVLSRLIHAQKGKPQTETHSRLRKKNSKFSV